MHSKAAAIPAGITEFARRMGKHARITWLEEIGQLDFYDRPGPVRTASDALAKHFSHVFESQRDVAAVTTIVEGVAVLADLGNFDALEALYARDVRVDYSSISGEAPATKTARQLMIEWASILPGFDRTRHALSRIVADVHGDRALVTADFTADHFLGESFWQARGHYRYELRRIDGTWRITGHRADLTGEAGTRDVFGRAAENAAANPSSYVRRQRMRPPERNGK